MKKLALTFLVLCLIMNCSSGDEPVAKETDRSFRMGFTSWSYGPTATAQEETYAFIQKNGDIYSEHLDDRIPWQEWINNSPLPIDFVQGVDYKLSKRDPDIELVLSVSLLNTSRDDLKEDWSGSQIEYNAMNDQVIEDAYFKHLEYLITRFNPDYLIASMELNDLLINSPGKWEEYKLLMNQIRPRLKQRFPSLPIAESITLHNFYLPQSSDPNTYIQEVSSYVSPFDFVAVSFYPFFKNLHTKAEYQAALDFLDQQIEQPIAFVETSHLSEDLVIPNLNTNITGNLTEQKEYLEVLTSNAQSRDYPFIIWWAYRDYDALWETFPAEVKDIGQIWRDTGLLDEDGNERPAFSVWQSYFAK